MATDQLQADADALGLSKQDYLTLYSQYQQPGTGPSSPEAPGGSGNYISSDTATMNAIRQALATQKVLNKVSGGSTSSGSTSSGSSGSTNMGQNIDNPNKELIDIGARATNSVATYNPTPGKADTKTGTSTGKMTTSNGVPAATQNVAYQMPGVFQKATNVPMSVSTNATVPQVQANAATYTGAAPPTATAPSQPTTISLGKLPTEPPAAPTGTTTASTTTGATRPPGWGTGGAFHSPVNQASYNAANTTVPSGATAALGTNMTNQQKANFIGNQASDILASSQANAARTQNAIKSIPVAQNAAPSPEDFMYGRYKLPNIALTGGMNSYA